MDRNNLDTTEPERDLDEGVTRNGPILVLLVEHCTGNVPVDSIRDISRDLSGSETGIEDSNKLTIRCRWYDRIEGDVITVRPNDAVGVNEDLPTLVSVS